LDVKIDSLVPYHVLQTDPERVFATVEKNGIAVLLKDNKPAYIVLKYKTHGDKPVLPGKRTLTLHEAMKIVLSEAPDRTMHAAKLADEIYERKLYVQRNGGKASYMQIRARCTHYKHLFEALPGNRIRLKEEATDNASKQGAVADSK